MNSRRRLLIAVGASVVAAATWWWFARAPIADVDVAVVTVGPLRVTIDETGTTRVRAHTDVNAPVGGRWVPVSMQEGDVLPSGARLGTLYPAPMDAVSREQAAARVGSATALVHEAEARLTSAQTARQEARRTLTRTEAVGAAGGLAPQEVERARDAMSLRDDDVQAAGERLRVARYELAQARAASEGASGKTAGITLRAPMAGTVLSVAEPHERVVAPGSRLLEIGDPRDVEVVVPLLTADALRVQEGAAVRLTFGDATMSPAEPRRDTIAAQVHRIDPSAFTRLSALGVEEQRVNVIVRLPATALHVGDHFRADARITVWDTPRALRAPASALARDGEAWTVWVVKRGRALRRAVVVGAHGADQVEVRAGLQPGDTVVLFPGEKLVERSRVRVR